MEEASMRKTNWFAVAIAALIVMGVGGWVTSITKARATRAAAPSVQIDVIDAMKSAGNLPIKHPIKHYEGFWGCPGFC
jgi:hypothetical protein